MNQEKLRQLADEEQPENDIYERFSEAEDFEDYTLNGYHPVTLGDKFHNGVYQVIQKLGWGHFSTVWLVLNTEDKKHYALKIQKSKDSYQESAQDELDLLKDIQDKQKSDKWKKIVEDMKDQQDKIKEEDIKVTIDTAENYCVDLVDNFIHFGPHGKHYCTVFKLVGPNLLDLINYFNDRDKMMSIQLVKQITKQILVGLVYMHEVCDQIHTDIKPENVMIQFNENNFDTFIEKLSKYDKLPLSMKYLSALRESNSSKNKKKYDKKKKKKAAAKLLEQQKQEEGKEQEQDKEKEKEEGAVENTEEKQQKEEEKTEEKKEEQDKQTETTQDQTVNEEKEEEKEKKDEEEKATTGEIKKEDEDKKEEEEKKDNKKEKTLEEQWESDDDDEDTVLIWKNDIQIPLDPKIKIQIVDFGNATWHSDHFTDQIQTREYRSPEAIIKSNYEHNTDIWSLACMVFELLTNDYLFNPKPGKDYKKNDHHLRMIIETLGKFPKQFAISGKRSTDFFNRSGNLIKFKDIEENCDTISQILLDDYEFTYQEAVQIEDFLLPMLQIDPKKRSSAREALKHPWLWS